MLLHSLQWQKRQVEHYCAKYGLEHLEYALPNDTGRENYFRKKLYRHLIFDDKQKILFCFIPKVHVYDIVCYMYMYNVYRTIL